MVEKKQTSVFNSTDKHHYYCIQYPVAEMPSSQLIELSDLNCPVVIDSAGKFYKKRFNNVLIVESLQTIKEFELLSCDYDILISTEQHKIIWPKKIPRQADIIFDHSRLLKYKNLSEIKTFCENLETQILPNSIHIRIWLYHLNDNRLIDRFYSLSKFEMDNFIVTKFVYDTDSDLFEIKLRRKH